MRLTTGQKKTAGLGSEAVSKTQQTPEVCADSGTALANLKTKLLTIAWLFSVEQIGGAAVIGFWMWRVGHV